MKKKLMMIRILAVMALALSVYILWTSSSQKAELAGCGEGSGCEAVLQTKWSSWFGLPVSAGAIVVYGSILILTFSVKVENARGWRLLVFFSLLASASGVWFMLLQAFLIKSYCIYCSIVHLCGILITFVVLKTIPVREKQIGKKRKGEPSGIPANQLFYSGLLGVLGVLILAFGQMKSETPEITPVPAATPQTQPEGPVRTARLLNGAVPVKAGEFPVLGSMEANRLVAHLFDYTCPACRKLHPDLLRTVQSNRQNASVIMVPMPLDAECNPGVQQTAYLHLNACNFAEIGLAVWRAKPEAYPSYDHFMFQSEHPPTAEQARNVADQLVGHDVMEEQLNQPGLDRLIRTGIDIFYSSPIERKVLPILITPEKAEYGIPNQSALTAIFTHQ
jgi:uncharacterized membrane protein